MKQERRSHILHQLSIITMLYSITNSHKVYNKEFYWIKGSITDLTHHQQIIRDSNTTRTHHQQIFHKKIAFIEITVFTLTQVASDTDHLQVYNCKDIRKGVWYVISEIFSH
jgi:hypothetical protein